MCAGISARGLPFLATALFSLLSGPLWSESRPVVTVLDFQVDQVSQNEMKTLVSVLSSALFATEQFTVIDVSQRDALLREIEFSAADCTDEACQVEIGRLLAAEYVVSGRLGKIGRKYVVSATLLETSTSRTVRTADGAYAELEAVLDDLPSLAAKLAGSAARPGAGSGLAGPARPAIRPARTVAGLSCAGVAAACALAGGILAVLANRDFGGPVATAYGSYMAAPEGSADFVNLYQSYEGLFRAYRAKWISGLGLAGGAVVFAGVSVALLASRGPTARSDAAVSVRVQLERAALHVGLRIAPAGGGE